MNEKIEGKSAYGETVELKLYYGKTNGLAVTRDILTKNASGNYAVTHYPTGYRIAWYPHLWQAATVMELLRGLGPWDVMDYPQEAIDRVLTEASNAFDGL